MKKNGTGEICKKMKRCAGKTTIYKQHGDKNKQTIKKSEDTTYGKHIASGGIAQLYFIHHFNRK